MEIIFASNNKGKIAELKTKTKKYGINIISQKEANLDFEVEETGSTFIENAVLKAQTIHKFTKKPVIADDSGLEIDFLDGMPGVYSHRFAGPDATDDDRINKILDLLKDVPIEKRTARFKCAISYIDANGANNVFEGSIEGKIGFEKLGNNGFGYDPIFVLDSGKTFAEISSEEKNKISHRAVAVNKFLEFLEKGERYVK